MPPAPASAAVAGEARPPAPVVDLRDALPSPYVALIELIDGRGRRMIVPQDRCDGDTVELPAVV